MPDMSNAVASMVATIEIDKSDIKQQVLSSLKDAQAVVDGNTIKLQLAGDKKQITSEVEKIKAMLPEIGATIRLDMSTSEIQKQMGSVQKYVNKAVDEVQRTLKANSGKLNLNEIVKGQLGLKADDIVDSKAVKQALSKLNQQVKGFDLSKAANTAQIEEYVGALQSMQTVIKEINKDGSKFKDITSIGRGGAIVQLPELQKQVNSQLSSAMKQGSEIIATNADTWAKQIESSFNEAMSVAKHNLEVMANAMNELQKIGGDGTGNGVGNGTAQGVEKAKEETSELKDELESVSQTLSEINQKLGNSQTGNTINNLKDSVSALNDELAETKESINSIKDGISVNKDKFRSDLQDAIKEPLDLTITPKIDENAKAVDVKINPIIDEQGEATNLKINPILEDGASAKQSIQSQLNEGDGVKVNVEPNVNPEDFSNKIEEALKEQSVQINVEGLVGKVVTSDNVQVEQVTSNTTANTATEKAVETAKEVNAEVEQILTKERVVATKTEEITADEQKRLSSLQTEKDLLDGVASKKQVEAEIAKEEAEYDKASSSETERQAALQKALAEAKKMSSDDAKKELEILQQKKETEKENLKIAQLETETKKKAYEEADDSVGHMANGRTIALNSTPKENYDTAIEAWNKRVRLANEAKKLEEGSPERIALEEKAYKQLNKAAMNYQQYVRKTRQLQGDDAVKPLGGKETLSNKLLAQSNTANQEFKELQKTAGDLKVAWQEALEAEKQAKNQVSNIEADIEAQKKAVDRLVESEKNLAKEEQKANNVTTKDTAKPSTAKSTEQQATQQITQQNQVQAELKETTTEAQKTSLSIDELLNKSFKTKNKTEAFNQLKEASAEFAKYYNDQGQYEEAGRKAAYAYYKAYQEALTKEVAQSKLVKATIDNGKTDVNKFVTARASDNRVEATNGITSALTQNIAKIEASLKGVSEVANEAATKVAAKAEKEIKTPSEIPTTVNTESLREQIISALSKSFTVNLNPKTDTFIETIKERLGKANFNVNIKGINDLTIDSSNSTQLESKDFNELNAIINVVKDSIRAKTEEVVLEEQTVTQSVGKEVSAFIKLNEKLSEIKSNLQEIASIKIPEIKLKNTDSDKTVSDNASDLKDEAKALEDDTEALRENAEERRQNQQIAKASQQASDFGTSMSRYMRANKGFSLSANDLIDSTGFDQAKNRVQALFNEIESGSVTSKEDLNNLKVEFRDLKETLAKLTNSSNLKTNSKGTLLSELSLDTEGQKDYEQQLKAVAADQERGILLNEQYNATTQTLTYTIKTGSNTFKSYALSIDEANGGFRKLETTTKKTEGVLSSVFGGLQGKFAEVFRYFGSFGVIYKAIEGVRSGVSEVSEMDKKMTELAKVATETTAELKAFEKESFSLAGSIGTTASAVVESTADFERLGYSLKEASELAKNANVYANVGDMDISEATEDLVSVMKAFNIEAEHSIDVVDALNEVGNRYAVSSADLGNILKRSASALKTAGNSMEESIALGTAMNEVLQDADQAGKQNSPEYVVIHI